MNRSENKTVKLITWNVNSINVRLERLVQLIQREDPDIVCLQELKCTEDKFPTEALQKAGYKIQMWGQKTYNGVALLSKVTPQHPWRGWPEGDSSDEARIIAADFGGVEVMCVYVPNGQAVGTDKYDYKMKWLAKLHQTVHQQLKKNRAMLICGDFNIAQSDLDVHDPHQWKDQCLFSDPEKKALNQLLELGLVDLYRATHPSETGFTWWDYRSGAFPRNHGLRIDLILASSHLLNQVEDIYVDRNERKGEKPSDHAPVICVFKAGAFPSW